MAGVRGILLFTVGVALGAGCSKDRDGAARDAALVDVGAPAPEDAAVAAEPDAMPRRDAASVDAGISVDGGEVRACLRGGEHDFRLRFQNEGDSWEPVHLSGVGTTSVTGDRVTLMLDDGRTLSGDATGLAQRVPVGRWIIEAHHDPQRFTPRSWFVLRTVYGELRFAAWNLVADRPRDLRELSVAYTADDCATESMCGPFATMTMVVTSSVGVVNIANGTAADVGPWRVANSRTSVPPARPRCTDTSVSVAGYVTLR